LKANYPDEDRRIYSHCHSHSLCTSRVD
jgi:hypothetical protein